jgi:hypothetical protein
VSYDNGSTWTTSSVTPTFIDHKASECTKVMALNASGHVIGMVACDGSTSLTSGEINAALDNFHCSVTSIVFCGCTVTSIGDGVLCDYRNLTSVTIPSSVTTIGSDFLGGYTVRADGQYRKLKIEATTPPTLTSGSLGGLFNIIEVPCSGLYYYLNDVNWSKYYNKIQPIENCDEPPTPSNVKLFCIYLAGTAGKLSSGTTLCDGSTVINKSSINSAIGSGKLKEVLIGNCVTSISASTFAGSGFNLLKVYISDSVTSIGNSAFAECRAITNIVIPSGVTSISDYTFQYCQSLSSVTLPSGVTSIGNNAFDGCSSLTSFTIPDNVTSIGNNAFNGCNKISSINIPNSITTIGNGAFSGCRAITNITIPSALTSINDAVFYECSALESVTIPSNITSIGNQAFRYCSGLTSITCLASEPPALGNYAFDYTNNAPIYVPCQSVDAYKSASGWSNYASRIQCIFKFKAIYNDSSTLIAECDSNTTLTTAVTKPSGYQASGMTSAIIGDCITTIDTTTFNGCKSLSSITIPDSVTSIGDWSFTACVSLSSLTIPDSVTSIGDYAFYNCSGLASITVNATTPPAIGSREFELSNCPIYVPCDSINAYATASGWSDYASRIRGIAPCLKWKASYSGGTTTSAECDATGEIVQYEIAGNKLIGLEIGTCVTRIGDKMLFNYINFDGSITIPDSVTSIGDSVFFNCKKLRTVTIGSGVTSMGNDVFFACDNLSTVTINAVVPPTLGTEAFDESSCQIKVPSGSVNAYKSATNWSTYASRITSI